MYSHPHQHLGQLCALQGDQDTPTNSVDHLSPLTHTHTHTQIKTTAPTRYKVRPNVALVDGRSVAKVQVLFSPGTTTPPPPLSSPISLSHPPLSLPLTPFSLCACCAGAGKTSVSQDKFLVQTYTFSPEASLPDMEKLIEFWRALPSKDIREHR